jgi:hypothetical protein
MLKPIAAAPLLAWQLAPSYPVQDYRNGPCKVTCQKEPVPSGFTCAILIGLDPPLPEGIASIVGGGYGELRGATLLVGSTLYTAVFDPPLKPEDRFPDVESADDGIPARVVGNYLFIRWPVGREAKARIIRREALTPNRLQPA